MTTPDNTINPLSMDNLVSFHRELEKKYSDIKIEDTPTNPDSQALMAFNGYYAMDGAGVADGAFFTIDTNVIIKDETTTPIYDISLIISMNGTTSSRHDFTGTFDGIRLKQITPPTVLNGLSIDLVFARSSASEHTTVTFNGKITPPGSPEKSIHVTGKTYNNPIPYDMYIGKYHVEFLGEKWTPVVHIDKDYKLKYNYDINEIVNPNTLTQVKTYTYNLNMYVFSFSKKAEGVITETRLIMGTSDKGGLVCNNMTIDINTDKNTSKIKSVRPLQTVTTSHKVPPIKGTPSTQENEKLKRLGSFSGFYRISPTSTKPNSDAIIQPGAFISVEGEYTTDASANLTYKVKIGLSTNGTESTHYTFYEAVNFDLNNNTLVISTIDLPTSLVMSIKFDSGYTKNNNFGDLVSITGSVHGCEVTGSTPLNPVPLSGFKGATMSSKGSTLEINSDAKITYDGHVINEFVYVPVMYIVGFKNPIPGPEKDDTIILSLGTDGVAGNTCIMTNKKTGKVSVVYAIQ